jgi:hypothetical protein
VLEQVVANHRRAGGPPRTDIRSRWLGTMSVYYPGKVMMAECNLLRKTMGLSGMFSRVRMFGNGNSNEVSGINVLEGDNKHEGDVQCLDPATNTWISKKWQQLAIGDVVRVDKMQYFPADLLLLDSS